MSENFIPVTAVPVPDHVAAGGNTTVTVTISGVTQEGIKVELSSTAAGFFSSLPTSVLVPIGQNSASFVATLAKTASGSADIIATCNNGSVSGTVTAT